MVITLSTIPGREIKEVISNVTGISEGASIEDGVRLAEKEALLDIMNQAIKLGANAIIDLKITIVTYQKYGGELIFSKIIYTGTAVRI